jgi:hypothetical protein
MKIYKLACVCIFIFLLSACSVSSITEKPSSKIELAVGKKNDEQPTTIYDTNESLEQIYDELLAGDMLFRM